MVTDKAKAFWDDKQKLVRDFVKHLSWDLAIGKAVVTLKDCTDLLIRSVL